MEKLAVETVMGLEPEVAQGLSLLLFVLATLMFLLVIYAGVKRRARGQQALPGAAIVLLLIGAASFIFAIILKIS